MQVFHQDGPLVSADEPALRGAGWLGAQWERARLLAKDGRKPGAVLALDGVQKIPDWSEGVKRLWDEDTRARLPLHEGAVPARAMRRTGRAASSASSASCRPLWFVSRPLRVKMIFPWQCRACVAAPTGRRPRRGGWPLWSPQRCWACLPPPRTMSHPKNGEQRTGRLTACSEDRCRLGGAPIPLSEIAWIGLEPKSAAPPPLAPGNTSVVVLRAGGEQHGTFVGLSLGAVTLEDAEIDRKAVAWIRLADLTAGSAPSRPRARRARRSTRSRCATVPCASASSSPAPAGAATWKARGAAPPRHRRHRVRRWQCGQGRRGAGGRNRRAGSPRARLRRCP